MNRLLKFELCWLILEKTVQAFVLEAKEDLCDGFPCKAATQNSFFRYCSSNGNRSRAQKLTSSFLTTTAPFAADGLPIKKLELTNVPVHPLPTLLLQNNLLVETGILQIARPRAITFPTGAGSRETVQHRLAHDICRGAKHLLESELRISQVREQQDLAFRHLTFRHLMFRYGRQQPFKKRT